MKRLLLFTIAVIALTACNKPKQVRNVLTGHALGTTYKIVIWSKDSVNLDTRLDSLFKAADNSMSIFNSESLLSRINRNETDSLDRFLTYVISTAEKISNESGGYFDITVKPLVSAYGFAAEAAAVQPDIDSIMEFIGYRKINIENGKLVKEDPRVQIDLNAIAKGYTVSLVSDYLHSLGYVNHMVEIGGEISTKGLRDDGTTWVVTIDMPIEGNVVPGAHTLTALSFTDAGLATSGNYRRFLVDDNGRKYVHTINPLTGEPEINDMLQATVIAENTTLADGYATLFMVMGSERSQEFLAERDDLEAILVFSDENGGMRVLYTPGIAQ